MHWKRIYYVVILLAFVFGCEKPNPPPFPNHLEGYHTGDVDKGFSVYLNAAQEAEKLASGVIRRLSWTIGQKRTAIEQFKPVIANLEKAQNEGVSFVFAPYPPLSPLPERRGWRFLGRVMLWEIEESIALNDFDRAIKVFGIAQRFGWDLCGGDALDANLGMTIIQDTLHPIWKQFAHFSSEQLERVSKLLIKSLQSAPPIDMTLQNELITMKQVIQSIQEAFLSDNLQPYEKALGTQSEPAFKYLQSLKKESQEKQVEYFNRFANEAEERVKFWIQMSAEPPHLWQSFEDPKGERPWRRFAFHYFSNGIPLLELWCDTLARSRLMAVDAWLLAKTKSRKPLPVNIKSLPQEIIRDPYSHLEFEYIPRGMDYKLYSYGKNGKDDGGQGNPAGEPDLIPVREVVGR